MSASTALTMEDVRDYLASIAGEEHARTNGAGVAVSAADTLQVAEILRFANENGLAVTPSGNGTKMSWGNPVDAHVHLSTARMRSVCEHSWQDMTCTVDAGCPWAAMQAELQRHGQMVSLDPLWPERATVGGIVATNDGGAMRLKYGALRDLIIGMTIVLADGTVAKSGGKVVKNVAGYDLHKLMTGSFGTLGVITQVNFRLHPVEEHARTWSAAASSPKELEAPLRALCDSQIVPSCVQVRMQKQQCSLDIRIAAVPDCLDKQARELENIFREFSLCGSAENVWQARRNLFDAGHAVILKVSVLPSEVCAVLAELQQRTVADGTEISAVAQANGLMTVGVNAAADAAITSIELLRNRVSASGGSVVALQVPDEAHSRLDVWSCDSNALPLMREIKRRFDPNRILNPGRFVGNI